MQRREWLLSVAIFGVVVAIAFSRVMAILIGQWSTNDTYSFGVLVPLISAYFVWMLRHRLTHLPVVPSLWVGGILIGACALLLALGRAIGVIGLQEIAMVLMVPAAVWLLCGRRYVFALWFPLLYLLLMLPIWEILTDRFHYQSQLFSALLGERLLSAAGIPVHRSETYLELPNITLEVASVCSGVNFLVAVIAIGVPQAYLFLKGFVPRAIVIGFAVVIAVFSNGLRIAIIGFLSHYELTKDIHGPGHLLQGLFVSAAGLIALQAAISLLARRFPKPTPNLQPDRSDRVRALPPWRLLATIAAASIVVFAAARFQPSALAAASLSSADEAPGMVAHWRLMDTAVPLPFVVGGPRRNIGRTFQDAAGRSVDVYTGSLVYSEPTGGLGYRRVALPTRAALSEMPIETAQGTIFVNSVSYRSGDSNTDVAYWYYSDGASTSQVTTAKLATLWALLTGKRPLPILVVISRSRIVTADESNEPLQRIVADVADALK